METEAPATPLATTRITAESHERFGAFSGDRNPLHADAEAACRMEPGGLLAYGMDMVLWALEALTEKGQLPATLARLRARFLKWVYIEDEIVLQAGRRARAGLQRYDLLVNEAPVATLELFLGERPRAPQPAALSGEPVRRQQPRDLTLEQMEGRTGCAALGDMAAAASMYPRLAGQLGAAAITEFAACSYVIGMEAPGLYSMSMRYDLQLLASDSTAASDGLRYRVESADTRFRKVTIHVAGTHMSGTLEAFVRMAS